MKKLIFLLSIGFLISSCSREENGINNVVNDRLVFSDYNEFHETYMTLSKFRTEEELRFWAQSKKHSTLLDVQDNELNQQDTLLDKYSSALRTILNKDYEFEIGEKVVWFNVKTGELLGYPKSKDLSDKENFDGFTKIGLIKVDKVGYKTSKWAGIPEGGLDSRWQKEFTITRYAPCGGPIEDPITGTRKWVAELYHESFYSSTFHTWYGNLYLRIKLEERTPRIDWRGCPNYRELEFEVGGTALYMLGYTTISETPFSESGTYLSCGVSGSVNVLLAEATVESSSQYPGFNVSMSGWIRQHIVGDNTGQWTFPSDYPGGELW